MKLQLRDGNILCYDGAQVMGIINVTPDSFFAGSRCQGEENLRARVRQIVEEGGSMIDVGAYSTRPDADEVTSEEELSRLAAALPIIIDELEKIECRNATGSKYVVVSVDTFRADVAKTCVEKYGADIINDVSGGTLDSEMFNVIAETKAPYILMHMRGTPKTMQTLTDYPEGVTNGVMQFFEEQLDKIEAAFTHIGSAFIKENIIIDPGFGFAKTIEQNYQLFGNLATLKNSFKEYPLLVGISRKSMIYKLLETDANNALNGTSILNALAIASGAEVLRVHDVKEAVDVVRQMKG